MEDWVEPKDLRIPGVTVGSPRTSWLSPDTRGRAIQHCRKGQNHIGEAQKIEAGRITGYLLFKPEVPQPGQKQKVIIWEKFSVSVF